MEKLRARLLHSNRSSGIDRVASAKPPAAAANSRGQPKHLAKARALPLQQGCLKIPRIASGLSQTASGVATTVERISRLEAHATKLPRRSNGRNGSLSFPPPSAASSAKRKRTARGSATRSPTREGATGQVQAKAVVPARATSEPARSAVAHLTRAGRATS